MLSRKGAAGRVDSLRVPQAITGKPQGIPPWLRSRRDLYEGTLKRYSGAELRTRIGEAQQESDAIDRAGDGDTPSSPDFFQPVNDVNPHETPSHPTLTTPVDQGRHRGRFSIDTSPSSNLPLVESVGFGNGVYRVSYARRRDVPAPRQAQMPTWMQLS